MKKSFVSYAVIFILFAAIGSFFGSVWMKKSPAVKPKQTLIDSFKIDSITIKVYKDG